MNKNTAIRYENIKRLNQFCLKHGLFVDTRDMGLNEAIRTLCMVLECEDFIQCWRELYDKAVVDYIDIYTIKSCGKNIVVVR